MMLPDSTSFSAKDINRKKFADAALVDLVEDLKKSRRGQQPHGLRKLPAGRRCLKFSRAANWEQSEKASICVKQALSQLQIPIIAEECRVEFW